jgi:hypothetical protein
MYHTPDSPGSEIVRLRRVTIQGDCMAPGYVAGHLIEFEVISDPRTDAEFGSSAPEPGADYLFDRRRNTSTFKRLLSIGENGYELACLNQEKHPGSFFVPVQDVVRILKPVAIPGL